MAKRIMIQGTMSNAGKSLICAGLCRIFRQDGYRAAPFKSQNMALNSFITEEGLEMGRAQAVQAEAAGIKPCVEMNPVLLKPTSDRGSQVIVNGEVVGNMTAREYFAYKKELVPDIMKAFHKLEKDYDIIVIEGAGSPAEINLKADDIVNMGLARMVDAPVLLVGDIDRGGVFAQLLGTLMLLDENERVRVKGLIINKFRGDKTILDPGIAMLEERGGIPVAGVTPYLEIEIEDEDSLSERFEKHTPDAAALIDLAVIRTPRISNFTDFLVFENIKGVSLRYVKNVSELGEPDMILLPGTKNTIGDLCWMRQNGLEASVLKAASKGTAIWGICGGYQMLGEVLKDPEGVEGNGRASEIRGMCLLPVETVFTREKTRTQVTGIFRHMEGIFAELSGTEFQGYEIHMGETAVKKETMSMLQDLVTGRSFCDGVCAGNVCGTYVHGIFDREDISRGVLRALAEKKGITSEKLGGMDIKSFKEKQYDILADALRDHLDMEMIYEMIGEGRVMGGIRINRVEIENMAPKEIEKRSFEIITEELERRGIKLPEEQAPIIKRCIHTSADFDYAGNLAFSERAVEKALDAVRSGASIVTDTQMGRSGINQSCLERFGGKVYCFMSDEDVTEEAERNGTTRAVASMDKACSLKERLIFAVGNAPTALIRLYELIQEGRIRPELIIGVPVGFVNVVQSKELILSLSDTPYIVAKGRKGGSNIAACVCNALLYML